MNPNVTAKTLIKENFSIEYYKKVQARRRERLANWQKYKNTVLIKKEEELIEFGEKVLELMRIAYNKPS
ncbi:MAG: hypothetical protein HC836_39300 [Richelia sp. RM2_1_2]|nr:hypothetical protein [Richelia sp. RM2_1_2]